MSENSHTADWFKSLLSNRVDKTTKHGTDTWNAFANLKGVSSNLGHEGKTHSKFKPFSPIEMMAFIGLATMNGLTPSMRFEHKFKSQMEDPLLEMICVLGSLERARRWKEFKH